MDDAFVITSQPRLIQGLFSAMLGCGGMAVVAAGLGVFTGACCSRGVLEPSFIAIGAGALLLGGIVLLVPTPTPRALVRADKDGITLPIPTANKAPAHFITVPWNSVGQPFMRMEDHWQLVLPLDLPEPERIRLRNVDGGYARRADGLVEVGFAVPIKRRGAEALAAINARRDATP